MSYACIMTDALQVEMLTDDELDQKAVELRITGLGERQICKLLGISCVRLRGAIDQAVQDALTPVNQLRSIYLAQQRINELFPIFLTQAKTGDAQSAMVVAKLLEQERISIGLGGPHAVNPIAAAQQVAPRPHSTERLRVVMEQFLLDDRTRLRHGGPGYGPDDPRDQEDRQFLAEQREAEQRR